MAIIGGILLNIGAFFTMKGWIYRSVMIYIVADICWIFLAYDNGDMVGMSFITIGTLLGVVAFYKMYMGKMQKKLQKGK
jgi:hypothetical protein